MFIVLSPSLIKADVMVEEVDESPLVQILNDLMILSEYETDDIRIRIFGFYIAPGSGGRSGTEDIMSIYIAVSEYGEYPEQKLFKLDPLYKPSPVTWDSSSSVPTGQIDYLERGNKIEMSLEVSIEGIKVSSAVHEEPRLIQP